MTSHAAGHRPAGLRQEVVTVRRICMQEGRSQQMDTEMLLQDMGFGLKVHAITLSSILCLL